MRRSWDDYIDEFHETRSGITEDVVAATEDLFGRNPYLWLADALECDDDLTVDLGCGSGACAPLIDRWIGLDRSGGELSKARLHHRGPLIRSEVAHLPMRSASVDTALAGLVLMVVADPRAVLFEAARVLRPGGRLVAVLPAHRPLLLSDLWHHGRLVLALRRRAMVFPSDAVLGRSVSGIDHLLDIAGFEKTSDVRQRFSYPIRNSRDAESLVDSLYLPGITPERESAAIRALGSMAGKGIGFPLRRIVASRR